MKKIVERLLVMRNTIDDIISQLENEFELTPSTQEPLENIIFNELRYRGFSVDVGVVEVREKTPDGKEVRKQLEIDFVANSGSKRYYLQSAFNLATPEKDAQERRPFQKVNDSFKKIILVRDNIKIRRDESGIVTMGVLEFLLNPNSLEL